MARSFSSLDTTIICELCRTSLPTVPPTLLTRSIVTRMVFSLNVSRVSRNRMSLIPSGSSSPSKLERGLVLAFFACLTQCATSEADPENAVAEANANTSSNAYGQPLTAVNGQGTVTIMEGTRAVSTLRTASPNIEETRFISEQNQIVVKSRGNHGPATVQLFNSRTGRQEGSVMAYEIANGGPTWAAGMAE